MGIMQSYIASYETAMRARGYHVRLIQEQTGPQYFRFLMQAAKELVGMKTSTDVIFMGGPTGQCQTGASLCHEQPMDEKCALGSKGKFLFHCAWK